jgi:hypothetical protein
MPNRRDILKGEVNISRKFGIEERTYNSYDIFHFSIGSWMASVTMMPPIVMWMIG